jgi:tetratricopeptide (TPR) repeat protein
LNRFIFRLFLVLAVLLSSCSTDKNRAVNRGFHNMTSRFNGYFNANEIIKMQETTLEEGFKDDYSQLLPLFIYPDEEKSQTMYSEMDKVIEKCSEVIERHSIYERRQEYVKWIDDSYFLIGKARLYKQEFGLAEQTFLYVYQGYKKDPARYRGLNWLVKTFIETEQWDRAEEFLDLAEDNIRKYPEEYIGHYHAILADFHLKRDQDYDKAIESLEQAVILTKEKDNKRRYSYVLAQLYQKKKNFLLATETYAKVLKLNPNYIMRFNARISRAIAFDVNGSDSRAIKKELNKMLKDIKNEEFKDQIYFALAELALKEDNEPLAVEFLQKSVNSSVSNDKQKALSYLRLANLYFERPDYIAAQERYDSTLQFLPEDHPDYYPTEDKNNNLQDLVRNLKIIKLQDSLLILSNLSSGDREKKVKEIIEGLKAEDERKKQAELNKLAAAQNQTNPGLINVAGGNRKGKWYFYNPTTMGLGINDFKSTWGDIPLADNWRRGNKNASSITEKLDPEETQLAKQDSMKSADLYNPNVYLMAIPKDYQEQLNAHGKVTEALFNVGTIFKESFKNYVYAINSFERITEQYDTSRYNLPAHYQLYRIYKITEFDEKADIEKEWVLDKHPFSEYAYLIKNPNYSQESKATKEKVEAFYVSTYKLYKYGLYSDVINSCEKADGSFDPNHLKAKFDLLKTQSIGKSKSKIEFKMALEKLIKDHPSTPEQKRAQEILTFLNQQVAGKGVPAAGQTKVSKKTNYRHDPKEQHMMIVSAKQNKTSGFNSLKNKLSDFNRNSFREIRLSVTQSALGDKDMFLVRGFKNESEADRYYRAIKNDASVKIAVSQTKSNQYIISNSNFRLLFKSKDEEEYIKFFKSDYNQ